MKPTTEDLDTFAQHLNSMPPIRPHLSPHNSHSVPSTPFSHARKNSFGARSPSPTRTVRNGSPKSVHSNLENGYRSKAPSFTGCKFETGMAFSRRRIPYSIGGDQLERAKAPPKKFLSPDQEVKLSTDMRELFDRILPSKESDEKRAKFVQKLEKILNDQWPGNEIKVHVFGSSGNMLCTSDSDVDICITTKMKALERVCLLAKTLADHGMEKVICVPHAKVPIVKFWDPELGLACDMNVNNTLALENTRMIRTYVEIDGRVRPLAMIIKHWTKRRILNDAALGGTLSSYTWICMILNFLQTRNPPILPSLHKKSHGRKQSADLKVAGFNDNVDKLRDFGASNKESIGELLFNFFRRYAHDLDYEKDVVSVREGRLISKEAKTWHLMQNNRLCVEEPFNTERNLGNTVDDISFRGIHLELRRAFDLIADARLEECLEQYEFPPTEEKFWEKPTPKPTPVIRSRSQSNSSRRGGHQTRGGGRHSQHKNTGRRASSAAATNKYPLPPIDHLPQMPPGLRGRNFSSSHDPQELFQPQQAAAVHDYLVLSMQALHEQEQQLRLKQQQNAEAAAAKMHAEPMERRASQPFNSRSNQSSVAPSSRHVPMSAPLRGGQFFQPWIYPQVPGTPIQQQSIHTQPSSPSMKAAQPDLRRSLHRSNGQDHNGSSNMRSHSQPARPLPMAMSQNAVPPMPLNSQGYLHYQQLQQFQQYQHQRQLYGDAAGPGTHHLTPESLMNQAARRLPIDRNNFLVEDNVPKEYVGYWMNDSPPQNADEAAAMMAHFPAHHQDMLPRVRGVPPSITSLRRGSRSPSPSPALPFRDRSYSVRSASSAPISQNRFDPRYAQAYASSRTGPIIMNGTNGWNLDELPPMVDNASRTTTISEATSSSDDHLENSAGHHPGSHIMPESHYTREELQHYFHPQAMPPEIARMPAMNYSNGNDTVRRRVPPVQNPDAPSPPSTVKRVNRPTGNALGIQFGDVGFQGSPAANGHPPQEHPPPKVEQTPTVTKASGQFEQPAAPVPLLSPVREVRTPSPLGKRLEKAKAAPPQNVPPVPKKLDLRIPTFAELVRAREAKQNGRPTQRANGAVPTSKLADAFISNHKTPSKHISPQFATANPAPSNASINLSPRQISSQDMPPKSPERQMMHPQASGWQQQSSKKSKKNRSRPGSEQFGSGEPLPVNEAERKGG